MDLRFLDKSSAITPFLVRLYDKHQLYGALGDTINPTASTEFSDAIAEVLGMQSSPRETELVADVLIDLIRQARSDFKKAVADRLSSMDNVPLRLVLQLTHDDIEVAGPVLANSPILDDLDLIYIIKSQGPEYWQSIASRKRLNEQVMNILADTGDLDTAITLVENMNIKLSEHAIVSLSDLAQGHDVLALPLLRREEVGQDIAAQLYAYVGEEVKAFIKTNYVISDDKVNAVVEGVMTEFTEAVENDDEQPVFDTRFLTVGMMIATLRRGQMRTFVSQFAQYTGLDTETVKGTLMQTSGQGLAVACRAFDILKDDFVSIYLLTNRIRSEGKMIDFKDMTKAIGYYNRITPEMAKEIMQNSIPK